METTTVKAIVIGAGIGGLGMAIRLAAKGYEVDVFEAQSQVGGKLNEVRLGDYRFDAGPSLFTLPTLVDELFELAGKNPRDYFQYHQLELICKYHFHEGTIINAWQDVHQFAREVNEKTSDTQEALLEYLQYSRRIYELTANTFLFSSLHRPSTFLTKEVARTLTRIHRLDLLRTMHQAIASKFTDPRMVQLFDRYATYNGSNPYVAPATLNVIPHLEHNVGAFFPKDGMYSIATSLETLARELGVQFHFNTPVTEIRHDKRELAGIYTASTFHPADIVVSDVDVVTTYKKMLPKLKLPNRYLQQTRSTSALIFYWGIDRTFPDLDLHNIFFSGDYKQEFEQLFDEQQLVSDPTVYVFISKKAVPADAPEGCENWFVMINAPRNTGQDWEELIPRQRQIIWDKLHRHLGINIQSHIQQEATLDPRTIESKTGSFQGALYGNSSNSKLAAFLRHPNFSRKVKGLYFTGGSVHPGGGIPLCLASAKIVDGMINSA